MLEDLDGGGDNLADLAGGACGDNLEGCKEDRDALADLASAADEDDKLKGCGDSEELLLFLPHPRQYTNILCNEDSLRHR